MNRFLGLFLVLAACGLDEASDDGVDVVEQGVYHQPEKCPDSGCGMNSPQVEGNFFHELNLDGLPNATGWTLSGTGKKGTALYDITVEKGRITGKFKLGTIGSPGTVSGDALEGLTLGISRNGVAWNLRITDVQRIADYWARPIGLPAPARIESYHFVVSPAVDPTPDDGLPIFGASLCGATDDTASDAIPDFHAVVFEGERVSAETMTVTSASPRWFNIGCAGSALAKLQLTGHTNAAQAVGFTSTIAEHTTMLKALVGDFCGHGKVFTVKKQPLHWADHRGTITLPDIPLRLESMWDEKGAACLNVPRLDENPSAASQAAFGSQVIDDIITECGGRLPYCADVPGTYHLTTHNPI